MKTHILQLEAHDDAISTRDKMGWGKSGRILLVWPKRGRILTRRLDLVLVQRHSASLGAQLALVTRDRDVRYHARQLGIPVFSNPRRAQGAHWRAYRRFRQATEGKEPGAGPATKTLPPKPGPLEKPLSPGARLFFFSLGVVALLAIAAVLVPSARLTLEPRGQEQVVNLNVEASPQVEKMNYAGQVPAHLKTVVVEGRASMPVSGSVYVPEFSATGRIRLTNLTDQPVKVPVGLVVAGFSPGPSRDDSGCPQPGGKTVRFVTTQSGEVPAGPGESITLNIKAAAPGTGGNMPAESLNAVEGKLGTQLSTVNLQPTSGGTNRTSPAPNDRDRSQLFADLMASLEKTAQEELRSSLAPGDLFFTSTFTLSRILEQTYGPESTQPGCALPPANLLSLALRVEYQALAASGADLRALASAALAANIPVGYTPVANTLAVTTLTSPGPVGGGENSPGLVGWQLQARQQLQAQVSPSEAVALAMGLSPLQAQQRLVAALPLANAPQVALTPAWWPRLPVVPFRITVNENPGR